MNEDAKTSDLKEVVMISAARLNELKEQLRLLKSSLAKDNEEGTKMGGPMDSFKEAAAFQVILGAKKNKIAEFEDIIATAQILPDEISGKIIQLGKWFTIDNGIAKIRYRLVHPAEADPSRFLISKDSPLGKAVSGGKSGTVFKLNDREFRIINVE